LLLRRRAAADRRSPAVQQSIDISYPPRPQQQTRRTLLLQVTEWDRQTDGRTPYRFIDPAPHTMRIAPPKLRPYGAIQICLLLLLLLLLLVPITAKR